jgi:tetratricopeptide (TPR) repeat protein
MVMLCFVQITKITIGWVYLIPALSFCTLPDSSDCFCFLLGAGASRSSGIPTGWELSRRWWDELKEDIGELEWMKKINNQNVGEHYTRLYEERFKSCPALGYQEFEYLMEGKTPGLGYIILAQILAAGQHKFVITTNFDYLIEDAVRLYTSQKPFIAGHETLAGFISPQNRRPTVIKVHRDLFLRPFNRKEETETLKEEWANALSPLLGRFYLLVIGYGGNDGSLMKYLKQIDQKKRKSIYWCILKDQEINKSISELLTEKDFIVEIDGFDELMYALNEALDFDIFKDLDKQDEHPFVQTAKETVKKLDEERTTLATKLSSQENKDVDISALQSILSGGTSKILLEVYKEKDVRKKEELYRQGLAAYPDDPYLLMGYAGFLYKIGRADEGAGKYRQAVSIKPDFHEAYYNWGADLGDLAKTKTGDEAEVLYNEAFEKYRQAVSIKPDFHEAYNNWGDALTRLAKTKTGDEAEALYNEAFEKYRQAMSIKQDKHEAYNNWGIVLIYLAQTKTGDEAEALYFEAFEKFRQASASGGRSYNLARLYAVFSDREQALYYLEKSLERKEITTDYVRQDSVWDAYHNNDDFIALLRRFE